MNWVLSLLAWCKKFSQYRNQVERWDRVICQCQKARKKHNPFGISIATGDLYSMLNDMAWNEREIYLPALSYDAICTVMLV